MCFISSFAACPKSTGYKKLNGVCYFFSQTSKTVSHAVIDCKQKGGKLAEPKDDRTRKILIEHDFAKNWPWIGIKKVGSSWKWVSDGSTVAKMDWSSVSPKDDKYNCIMIHHRRGYFAYNCNERYRYICEF